MRFNISYLHSLKTRVTLFTLAIFLISLWLLAFYASRVLRHDMQRLLGDQQFSTATFVASDINGDQ
jgi:sensor histidine kinase regulating citrate/malate metabolism